MLAMVLVSILHSSHAFRIYLQGLERRAFFAYKPFRHSKTIPPDRFLKVILSISSGCKFHAVLVKTTTLSRRVVCMSAMVLVRISHSGHAFRIYLQGLERRAFFAYSKSFRHSARKTISPDRFRKAIVPISRELLSLSC